MTKKSTFEDVRTELFMFFRQVEMQNRCRNCSQRCEGIWAVIMSLLCSLLCSMIQIPNIRVQTVSERLDTANLDLMRRHHVLLYNKTECETLYGRSVEYWQEPALLLLANHIRFQFDYMWILDVRCNGAWSACMNATRHQYEDLLCSQVIIPDNKTTVDSWHWDSLEGRIESIPLKNRLGCILPIHRFTRRAVEKVNISISYSRGYCEVYFPTLLIDSNFSVGRIHSRSTPGDPAWRVSPETLQTSRTTSSTSRSPSLGSTPPPASPSTPSPRRFSTLSAHD